MGGIAHQRRTFAGHSRGGDKTRRPMPLQLAADEEKKLFYGYSAKRSRASRAKNRFIVCGRRRRRALITYRISARMAARRQCTSCSRVHERLALSAVLLNNYMACGAAWLYHYRLKASKWLKMSASAALSGTSKCEVEASLRTRVIMCRSALDALIASSRMVFADLQS